MDELLILLLVAYLFFTKLIQNRFCRTDLLWLVPVASVLLTYASLLLNGSWVNSFYNISLQSLISFKFFILIPFFVEANKRKVTFDKILLVLFVFTVLGFLLNYFYPELFINEKTINFKDRDFRIVGFQFKPNDMAILCSLCFGYFVNFGRDKLGYKMSVTFSIIALLIVILSTSRTGLAICMIFLAYWLQAKNRFAFLAVIFFLPFAWLFEFEQMFFISETIRNIGEFSNIEQSNYIRFIMIYYSFIIAQDYFPFGSGAASFGTVLSANSEIYKNYGLSSLEFFDDFWGIFDSNLASLLGEYGFIFSALLYILSFKLVFALLDGHRVSKYFCLSLIIISILQPFYSYHVNSVNLILVLFCMKQAKDAKEIRNLKNSYEGVISS
ncbi:hypothetical protein ACQKP8_08920 [Photobacterium alginatilyticum]|uniref:hypothetical protein n=1 Tax=Photobacterium alginatilyticum TaxID=1775171 RepID=UPI0040685FDA